MTIPAIYDEQPHTSGTTWTGYTLTIEDEDGNPQDLTGADARMQFKTKGGTLVFDWELGAELLIDDPTSGKIAVVGPAGGIVSATPGVLSYDLKVTLATGEVFVDIRGDFPIVAGVTA